MSDKQNNISVTFTNKTVFRVLFFVILAFVLVGVFSKIETALKLIMISVFLTLALNPIVSRIRNYLPSKSRVRATAVAYLAVVSLIITFIAVVSPPLIRQSIDFADQIPLTVEDIQNKNTPIVRFIQEHNMTTIYANSISDIKDKVGNVSSRAVTLATAVGGGLISIITVLVMTFMMLIEGPRWLDYYYDIIPKSKLKKQKSMFRSMYRMVTGYVLGQFVVALIAATFAFFALVIASTILGVNINPIAMASIVGLLGLIPMIGNIMAATIVVIFCLFASMPLAIIMTIYFVLYQQIENATLQPYIQAKYNELTPLTVFIAAIIGVSIAGFLGALVAIPVAGCIKIYIKSNFANKLAPLIDDNPN